MSLPWWIETKGNHSDEKKAPTVAQIKRNLSMAKVLKHYGVAGHQLEQYFDDWIAISCPFHRDRRPSASYNYRHQRFRCHTCDVGGDVIDVVSHAEGLSTKEAMEWISRNLL